MCHCVALNLLEQIPCALFDWTSAGLGFSSWSNLVCDSDALLLLERVLHHVQHLSLPLARDLHDDIAAVVIELVWACALDVSLYAR